MTRDDAERLLNDAIDHVTANHRDLLTRDANERTLCHHLAIRMAAGVPADVVVDPEYNRHGDRVKQLQLPPRTNVEGRLRLRRVYPDIVVHQRGTDEQNLLVVEVKKPEEPLAFDRVKLRAFKRFLRYHQAAILVLGLDAQQNMIRTVEIID